MVSLCQIKSSSHECMCVGMYRQGSRICEALPGALHGKTSLGQLMVRKTSRLLLRITQSPPNQTQTWFCISLRTHWTGVNWLLRKDMCRRYFLVLNLSNSIIIQIYIEMELNVTFIAIAHVKHCTSAHTRVHTGTHECILPLLSNQIICAKLGNIFY